MPLSMGTSEKEFDEWRKDRHPLIGHEGEKTFPFFSDPSGEIPGAIAIRRNELLYNPKALSLHQFRDSYRYASSLNKFGIKADFLELVKEFICIGYQLKLSDIDFTSFDQKELIEKAKGTPLTIDELTNYRRN